MLHLILLYHKQEHVFFVAHTCTYTSTDHEYNARESALEIIDGRKRARRPVVASSKTDSPSLSPSAGSGSGTPGLRGTPSLVGMAEWLLQIGHSAADVNALNIIHIAGTKGKGSTCAFTESFLRAHGQRTGYPAKTGLYTSPHLIHPEERIRLDGTPIDRSRFVQYFFEIYDRLPQLHSPYNPSKEPVQRGPRNLQLYALLAFHAFIRERVDVAIFETHSGGEYDATNVVQKPLVTVITTLGMDHVATLGPRMENIAWHKAGIFKSGAVALSTVQDDDGEGTVERVLRERAGAKGEVVRCVAEDERLPAEARQLEPRVLRKNASLALAAAEAWLDARSVRGELSAEGIRNGVEQWSWPGRFQVVHDARDSGCMWYLDAAHNDMSVAIAAQWFAAETAATSNASACSPSSSSSSPPGSGGEGAKILIFSHINELRDSAALLRGLAKALRDCGAGMGHVIFTSYATRASDKGEATGRSVEGEELLHETWRRCQPGTQVWDEPSIEDAIERARKIAKESADCTGHVLITGSQHLVGPALGILQP
ncbi:hypothetical protein B0A55_10678 [Friedmanniomyces simplex]|uniref:tetrahydrofolate synthase n=1 Tax=Friedmanniomyces simplex TaxID=329884 RepID=A0A4U0WLE2_9PEZI|nr:hypothetical protein B0A55_10678 [Friedmanniomyces simplex]